MCHRNTIEDDERSYYDFFFKSPTNVSDEQQSLCDILICNENSTVITASKPAPQKFEVSNNNNNNNNYCKKNKNKYLLFPFLAVKSVTDSHLHCPLEKYLKHVMRLTVFNIIKCHFTRFFSTDITIES